MSSGDPFSDVRGSEIGGFGSLGGGASEKHYQVGAKPVPEGYEITCTCDNCGVPNNYLLDWGEITFLANGVLPDPSLWYYDQGRIVPNVGCRACRRDGCKIGITPDEAKRWVNAGLSANFVKPQAVQQWSTAALQRRT